MLLVVVYWLVLFGAAVIDVCALLLLCVFLSIVDVVRWVLSLRVAVVCCLAFAGVRCY